MIKLQLPVSEADILSLRAGDEVEISGVIYTARDAAHKRLTALIEKGEKTPIDLKNSAIYYVGPTPKSPGRVIGSAGPTSSYRMDAYTDAMLGEGVKIMIGKGPRSQDYKDALKKYGALYMSAIGGAAASISESIKKCEIVAYEDLGAEAIYRLEVRDFYAIVTYDAHGGDLFEEGIGRYKK